MTLNLKIITGSTRPGRVGPNITRWVEEIAAAHATFNAEVVDLANINLPLLDEPAHPSAQLYEHQHTKQWSGIVGSADAFIFVTPEYDYFAPAGVVNAIQALYREWSYKAASVVSYGAVSGGIRSAQTLLQLLNNVNVHALPQVVPVPFFWQHIGEDGVFRGTDAMRDGLVSQLNELHKWATALKKLRLDQIEGQKAA